MNALNGLFRWHVICNKLELKTKQSKQLLTEWFLENGVVVLQTILKYNSPSNLNKGLMLKTPTEKYIVYEQETNGQNSSPEKQFQSLKHLQKSCDYTVMLIMRTKSLYFSLYRIELSFIIKNFSLLHKSILCAKFN